ncbi:hypothetical protein K501DRAFT_293352 [Backusella circina FSU 941]|nr:hypothetical protein K501DRAFT_293352 [Backusella circina FSU 941]
MLPSLEDILSRKTLPPICLYNFYIVMRDTLQLDNLLDFYLDVRHHEIVWRRYIKSMLKSGTHLYEESILIENKYRDNIPTNESNSTYSNDLVPIVRPPIEKLSSSSSVEENGRTTTTCYPSLPNKNDLTESARRIIYNYLVPNAPKELCQLSPSIKHRIISQFDLTMRYDPMLFADAKYAAFVCMECYAYPSFIRLKVFGNITWIQQVLRLLLGLFSMTVGFTTAFSFLFLGYPTWGTRLWSFLPFWIGFYNLFVFLSKLDPIWAILFNISETTTFHFNVISQPEVKRIMGIRAAWLLVLCSFIAIAITVLFCAIPSKKL